MKPIGLGIEDFKELIDGNYYYSDKTDLISSLFNQKVVLYTRPRRFGKTLNMSMLYYFFSNREQRNSYLFNHLKITTHPDASLFQNQYPVIFISLKEMTATTFEEQINTLQYILQQAVLQHRYLLKEGTVEAPYQKFLNDICFQCCDISHLRKALQILSNILCEYHHQKVILLIDEYDVPLQAAYTHGYYEQMVDFLRSLFSSALKTNNALSKGIMTGCLRIARESIFTGLNNFTVNSIFTKGDSSSFFGFTQNDIDRLLKCYNLIQYRDTIKEWYDGYLFGDTDIYNPWSVLQYIHQILCEGDERPQSFWLNTSSNSIVMDYISQGDDQLHQDLEKLVNHQTLVKRIRPDLTYREMDDINNIYSFLLFTGYLRVTEDLGNDTYRLMIPNREVLTVYNSKFLDYYESYTRDKRKDIIDALKHGNADQATIYLNEVLSRSLSYYDNHENFYHGLLAGLFSGMDIESNKEAGDGRYDLIIRPSSIMDTAIIIECKHSKSLDQLRNDSLDGAKQIRDRHYAQTLLKTYSHVEGYGISFCKKACHMTRCTELN